MYDAGFGKPQRQFRLNGMKQNFARLADSVLAYGSALLITATVHEFGHGLTALLFGQHPTVYGLHEEDIASSATAVGVIAAAGPIVSLIVGLIFLAIHKRLRGQGFGRYLTLWLGLLGIATFFGYLLTAPFYKDGDVYKVLAALGLASPLFSILSFLVGAVGVVQLARAGLPCLLNLTNRDMPLRPQMMALGFLTWLMGSGIVLLAMIPEVPYTLVMIGLFVPPINLFALQRDRSKPYGEPGATPSLSTVGIGLFIVLVLLEQTVLRRGIHL